jgi:hypothetical protein
MTIFNLDISTLIFTSLFLCAGIGFSIYFEIKQNKEIENKTIYSGKICDAHFQPNMEERRIDNHITIALTDGSVREFLIENPPSVSKSSTNKSMNFLRKNIRFYFLDENKSYIKRVINYKSHMVSFAVLLLMILGVQLWSIL